MKKDNVLSRNIKVLRKKNKISQEELAHEIGIKRSNITAYESKNVEPRLRVILDLARYFDINVRTLISEPLQIDKKYPSFEEIESSKTSVIRPLNVGELGSLNEFVDKSVKIRKVLEGFKAFYTFKKNKIQNDSAEAGKLVIDIDNFIQLTEHLLAYNESVIKALQSTEEVNV